MLMTDAPFVLALTLAFTTFYDSLVREPRTRLWTAVALGLAVLAKGPVAGVLFVGVAAVVFWRMPETRTKFRGHWLLGAVLFLAVVATWYVPAYLASGELFVREFLIEQNIGRFAGGDLAHRVPWWSHPVYFPLVLLLAAMPWSFWAARARWFERTGDPFVRYLWVWCLVVVAFFTVSGSKLPHYALPAVAPFVALTVLAVLERREDGATADFWLKGALAWSAVVFAVATPVFMLDYANRFEELHRIARHLREKEGFAVLYGVGRRDRDVEIKLSLNPSAHPSFLFYLRKDGRMTDEPETIVGRKGPVWIVAEQGEMDGELSQLLLLGGRDLVPYDPPFATEKYEVWLAEPR
jgi:4-amino-4-deoxy-L-arabinose transferase-like glycosyltransferase